MISSWVPPTMCSEEQEEYDEEHIWVLVHMHMTSDKAEQEGYDQDEIAGKSVAW